jgi:hypothetical protein
MRMVGLLAVLAATTTTGLATAGMLGHPVVAGKRIGPLRLDRSRTAAIERFAGAPTYSGHWALQYDCARGWCWINYFLRSGGRLKGRLVAAVLGGGPFVTARGVALGMTRAEALAREPRARAFKLCGYTVLRTAPLSADPIDHWVGLNLLLAKGRVRSFVIFSWNVKVTCARSGPGYEIWH